MRNGSTTIATAILLGLLALAGIASALGGGADGTPGVNCVERRADLNDDCVYNSADQLLGAFCYGANPTMTGDPAVDATAAVCLPPAWANTDTPEPSSTSTPEDSTPEPPATNTPVPTATNSPTPTPTPTSPPSAYTVEDLIFDTTGDHDGDLCGVDGFDWEFSGRVGIANAPVGTDQYTLWGTVQWVSCGGSSPDTHYQTRNLRGYIRQGPAWLTISGVSGAFEWCDVRDPDTTDGSGGSCPGSSYPGNPSDFLAPTGVRSLHWASFRRAFPGGTCIVVVYEARSTGGAVMANAGADWIDNGDIISDAFLGRYKRLDADWRHVGGSSCPASLLRSSPPPGF